MDSEFHYYINYIIALRAGFAPETAYKIAYSAQYVDDNTEIYTVLQKTNLAQYNNIITQSINPTLSAKDIISIYPIFHFIPGNDIIKSASLRRDGECRYMTTTPNNKLARNCLATALKSHDPYWIGIASHAFVDTWAHQNFTGLQDVYNCVEKYQTNKTVNRRGLLGLSAQIGHVDVFHLPDTPNAVWYDYRLKDMRIDNNTRFLIAAEEIFKMYIKYADKTLLVNAPKNPSVVWKEVEKTIRAIFTSDLTSLKKLLGDYYECNANSRFLIMKILGINKLQRIEFYKKLAKKLEDELGIKNSEFGKYDKNKWIDKSIYTTSDSLQVYDIAANDNNEQISPIFALSDSADQKYVCNLTIGEKIKRKLNTLLQIYKQIHIWKDTDYKFNDWYCFQEAAKKQYTYMTDKVLKIMRKDIQMMKSANIIP